ncbi:MAG: 4Fe-4S binding protein [Nanoarchaeota archaeon]|nr:4Fe-4S binding protein [Nanoarchaeota archaeon]
MKKKSYKEIPTGGTITSPGNSLSYETGSWKSYRPVRDKSKCTNCLLCFVFCPENCIKVKEGKVQDADLNYCKGCGLCASECPFKAITMKLEEECEL